MPTLLTSTAITAIQLKESASPGTPSAGYGRLYFYTDNTLHIINDAATDINLTGLYTGGLAIASQAAHDVIVATSATQFGRVANGTTGQVLAATTGSAPSWATLNQAAVAGLTTADGPSFAHLHLADVAAVTTAAESWVGPSSTTGVYFKGGLVGIGTAGPQSKLQIFGSTAPVQADAAGTQTIFTLTREGSPDVWREAASFALGRWKTGSGNSPFSRLDFILKTIGDNSSLPDLTVMTLQDNGYVGIGTTVPATRLDIDAGAMTLLEMTAPGAGAANSVRIYAVDNGAGKTQLMAIFASGAAQQLALQP